MIQIRQDGTKIVLLIDPIMNNGHSILMEWDTNSDWLAELLTYRLGDLLRERLRAIRREAYEQGWKDKAAKKKPKQTWFSGGW